MTAGRGQAARRAARIRLAKRLLLGAALFALLAVVGSYLVNRVAQFQPTFDPTVSGAERKGATQVGRGVDHTVTLEGRPVFRIRGRSDRQDRDGTIHVEQVALTFYREDGSLSEISAERGRYHPEKREAWVSGAVRLVDSKGFSLEAEEIDVTHRGQVIESGGGPVSLHGEGPYAFDGTAGSFRAVPKTGMFLLDNGVEIASRDTGPRAFSINAPRLTYNRHDRIIRAEGGTAMTWGASQVSAHRLAAHLHPTFDRLQLVIARWQVRIIHLPPPGEGEMRRLAASADLLTMRMDPDGEYPTVLDLEENGGPLPASRLWLRTGEVYDLTARLLQVGFDRGAVDEATALGNADLRHGFASTPIPLRRLCGRRVTVGVTPTGELGTIDLSGDVQLHEDGSQVVAAAVTGTPERLEATGRPVTLLSRKGTARAPRLVYTRGSSLAHLSGGVETTLRSETRNPLGSTPFTAPDEPVRVTADEAFWRERPQSFLYRGTVRAWSGDRILRAGQLRGDADEQTLTAADEVETVWFAPARNGAPPRRITVDGDRLIYDEGDATLTYEGGVRMVDADRTLTCRSLTVHLDDNGAAERMVAEKKVVLKSATEGSTVRADRGEYDLRDETAEFFGNPVELEDGKGGTVTGAFARYSLEQDTVRIFAKAPSTDDQP